MEGKWKERQVYSYHSIDTLERGPGIGVFTSGLSYSSAVEPKERAADVVFSLQNAAVKSQNVTLI